MPDPDPADPTSADVPRLATRLDQALQRLADAPEFAKPSRVRPVLDTAKRLLLQPGGCAAIEARAGRLEEAGTFWGSDWEHPETLNAGLSPQALGSDDSDTVLVEVLSDLRLVAVAVGDLAHGSMSPEEARHHLTQVLALNLSLLFGTPGEVERERQGRLSRISRAALRHVADRVGYEQVLDQVVDEIWRILQQRPIMVDHVKQMITEIAIYRSASDVDLSGGGHGLDRLITSLYGTTQACREDPGLDVYRDRLASMDRTMLQSEASGFARAMHDTGLVSPYHTALLGAVQDDDHLLGEALGLASFGRENLLHHRDLVHRLITDAIHPRTAQAVYGLALLLERGILHQPAVAPSLWRQLHLSLSAASRDRLALAFGDDPPPRTWLLAGVLNMLGQPLGVGQGDNPTCQAARALSMWAHNDPDYLLHMVVRAARDDEVVMVFEGQPISSREVAAGVAASPPIDLDPVSLLVVPHLDRIYAEMGRRCIGRAGDPHRWVNPEFHGWWAWRGFRINVDVATGRLTDLDGFLRDFHATYHPACNGDQPLPHPQPAGVAVTDSAARFVGWHAITILRVARDPDEVMRVYFFNPNNDSGQDWGDDVVVSTSGHGERFGESSLPFAQLASRLYIFHRDPLEEGNPQEVPDHEIAEAMDLVRRSWGADRHPTGDLQADPGVRARPFPPR